VDLWRALNTPTSKAAVAATSHRKRKILIVLVMFACEVFLEVGMYLLLKVKS
jgi:hypothetical protein